MEIHENLTFVSDCFHYHACMYSRLEITMFFYSQGDPIVEVSALDQDFGINDAIVYRIISGNLVLNGVESFGIDNETGVIYVNTATLDRETHTNYLLTVQVTDTIGPACNCVVNNPFCFDRHQSQWMQIELTRLLSKSQ